MVALSKHNGVFAGVTRYVNDVWRMAKMHNHLTAEGYKLEGVKRMNGSMFAIVSSDKPGPFSASVESSAGGPATVGLRGVRRPLSNTTFLDL